MSSVITARISPETLELVDRIAKARGRSRAWFVAQAVQRVAESEADFMAFVQEGLDDIALGDIVPHADVMRSLDEMIAIHQARCEE